MGWLVVLGVLGAAAAASAWLYRRPSGLHRSPHKRLNPPGLRSTHDGMVDRSILGSSAARGIVDPSGVETFE